MSRAAVLVSLLVLLLISVVPLGRTIAESVLERDASGKVVGVTTERYEELFVGPRDTDAATADETPASRPVSKRWAMLGNSAAIAATAALLAVLVGVPYAVLVARTDVACRGFLSWAHLAPLVLPPLLVGVAWSYLPFAAPPPVTSAPEPSIWDGPAAIGRAGGMFALCYFPLVVLFTSRALRRVPAPLEDAARLAAGPWRALRSVTLPLAAPTILASALFVFLFALEDFALVDFLNWVRPVGQRVGVYPYESFTAWTKSQGEGISTALGMPLVLLGIGLLVVIHRIVVRESHATVGSAFRAPEPWRLGRWRVPAAIAAFGLLVVSAGLPVGGLLVKSGEGGVDAWRRVWSLIAGPESQSKELLWTLWFAGAAAVLSIPLAFVLAHHAARRGKVWPLVLAFLPLALPPVFLGAGALRVWESSWLSFPLPGGGERNPFSDPDSPRFGSVLVLVAKYVPFAVAAFWASFLSIDPKLEEAAASAGVRPLDRALSITAPLARPAAFAALVLVFVFSVREIDTLVLHSSDTLMRRVYTMVHFSRDSQVAALCIIILAIQALPFAFLSLLAPKAAAEDPEA